MKELFLKKKRLLLGYFVCLSLFIVTFLTSKMTTTPLLIWSVLFFIIFVPGFLLSRIFQHQAEEISGNLVLWMSYGWAYALTLAFLAIVFSLTINLLVVGFLIITILLFCLSFFLELRRPVKKEAPINFQDWFKLDNIPLALLLVYLVSTLIIINLSGSWYGGGDVQYHLGMLRKTIEPQPLSVSNLSYVKDQVNVAYIFPVWHVLMGLVTKLSSSNMFSVWRELAVPLLVMVYMVWYWLSRKIMPSKNLAILSMFLFVAFSFNWNIGYVFKTLPIPHSLTQYLFVPLLVALALDFVFKPKANRSQLILVILLAILVGLVHLTGYFYFLVIMLCFLFVYLLTSFKDENFKETVKRILLISFTSLIVLALVALLMELKSHALSVAFKSFSGENYPDTLIKYTSFGSLDILSGLAFVCLPITFIFIKKYRQLTMILAVMLLWPLVYNPTISKFLIHILGYIFVKRLYGSVVWYFLSWALVYGVVVLIFDRCISCLKDKWRLYLNIFLGLFSLFFIWLSAHFKIAENLYGFLMSKTADQWLAANYLGIFIPLTVLAVFIYFYQAKSEKLKPVLILEEPRNPGWLIFSFVFIGLLFIFPSQKELTNSFGLKNLQKIIKPSSASMEKSARGSAGGQETVNFIRNNIPANSVFNARSGYFALPQVALVHMSDYSSSADTKYSDFYTDKWTIDEKLQIFRDRKIDYLLVKTNKLSTLKQIQDLFNKNPEVFEQVFVAKDSFAAIYKIHR